MSEDFVDVTWRGLEVARKARLRAIAPGGRPSGTGHLEHGTPMPIGTALVVTTAAGQTLGATVTAVREQIGGRTEPPGMDVAIVASGEAAAWWQTRVEAAVAAAAAAAEAATVEPAPRSRTRTAPPAEVAAAAAVVAPTAPTAPTAPVVPAPPVLPPAVEDARPTEVMTAVSAPDEDGPPTIEIPTLVAPPTGEPPADAIPEELADDSRRTTVMAAVDIEAIVAASADSAPATEGAPADDTGDAPASGDKKKAARGKRRRTR